jgi:tetratricopeptide (TPR) repeat protein
LWGGDDKVTAAIDAYGKAIEFDAKDALAHFRRGVVMRRRYESAGRREGDFQRAIDDWGAALALDPNQYIWRRRIQQYGPRLDKPYPFYDWVAKAEAAIRRRGEAPVKLDVRPGGAEIARPTRVFAADKAAVKNPDADGKIVRDAEGMIRAEVTVVPRRVKPGESARVHVVLRPNAELGAHWNNEAERLRLWIDPPKAAAVSARLVEAGEPPPTAVSEEERTVDFEVKIPGDAWEDVRLAAYALYNVCDDVGGQCRYLRLDLEVVVPVGK